MGFWALEDTAGAGAFPPFDGWDGCNVWVSVDSGKSLSVANPDTPAYICQNLYSFSSTAGLQNIAGWGGSSGGWIPVEFDLSAYKTDKVIVRFAFASYEGWSTWNDPALYGFFVDDIVVSDGGSVLFENHGEEDSTLRASGYAGMEAADWLDIYGPMGTVPPYDSAVVSYSINTRNLSAGRRQGFISFSSNDTTINGFASSGKVSLQIDVQPPQYDLAVQNMGDSYKEIPVAGCNKMQGRVVNCGQQDFSNFDAVLMVLDGEQTVYCDGVHIPALAADSSMVVTFEPFVAWRSGKTYRCVMNVINAAHDYNGYNNTVRSTLTVTNLISGFEQDTDVWTFAGGWGRTSATKKEGKFSVHNNSGTTPYLNNMDGLLTLNSAVGFDSLDNAVVKYFTGFRTEENKDQCFVEISGDRLLWSKIDSFSGTYLSTWEQREVSFSSLIEKGYKKGWLRFHFISDSANTDAGVYMDQVEIFPVITGVREDAVAAAPMEYKLFQNYPNPFNPKTIINYESPITNYVELSIYNILGQKVATLVSAEQPAGSYRVEWDASGFASGVYLYRLKTEQGFSKSKKLILLK